MTPGPPNSPPTAPVLLYDGTCGFCTASVQFILRHDRRRTLRFAARDSAFGRNVLARHPELTNVDSVLWLVPTTTAPTSRLPARGVLASASMSPTPAPPILSAVTAPSGGGDAGDLSGGRGDLSGGGGILTRSDAALQIARYLGGPWRLACLGYLIPRPLRDAVYRFIARHRHHLRGPTQQCALPNPADRPRFLP